MTRASRKNRRRKKAGITADPMALAPVPKRQPNGQKRRTGEPPATATVEAARMRHCAVAQDDALDPVLGTDMGRCIRALADSDERRLLIDTWGALSAARRNYKLRIIGQTGEPQNAALPMIHDVMETDPSLTVDLRTAEERDRAAIRAWRAWAEAIAALPLPGLKWAIRGALDGFLGEGRLWADGAPTSTGRAAVHALRKICEMC